MIFRVAQALGRTVAELDSTMDYAELREWEEYFRYEPTMADRLEVQLAIFMQMISANIHKNPLDVEQFMVCPIKRTKNEPKSKISKLWEQVTAILGDNNE